MLGKKGMKGKLKFEERREVMGACGRRGRG